jgi:hypothetical protein
MKMLSTLFVSTILTGAVSVLPALAKDASAPAQANASQSSSSVTNMNNPEYKSMLREASTMMGHIGVANVALLYGLTNEAAKNVQQALTTARKLEGQTIQLNADFIKFSKLKYRSADGKRHDYWLPVINDSFAVRNLDSDYLKSKQPNAEEEDAQMVNTKAVLDVQQMRNSLEKAASAIGARNYTGAQVDFQNAEQSTFADETVSELPLVTARENLVLARELAKSKDYKGSGFALSHANDALVLYQATAEKMKAARVIKLNAEIGALRAEIAENKPSVATDIKKHIPGWMHDTMMLGSGVP